MHRPTACKFGFRQWTGFSLIELLVVLAIVAVLAGLLLPALGQVRQRSDRVTALSQMHQIAVGLAAYPADHGGKLPGPLYPGQMPLLDPTIDGRLVLSLAPYLGLKVPVTPQLVPLFIPPAYEKAVTASFLQTARTYVMNMAVPSTDGTSVFNPWGSAVTGIGQPFSAGTVSGQAWAFSDADQLNPRVVGAPWQANTPTFVVHGAKRLAVRFDGSADEIDESELAMPQP